MSSRPNPTTLNLGLEVRDRGSLRTEQERDSLGGEAGCWTGRGGTGCGPPSEERPPLPWQVGRRGWGPQPCSRGVRGRALPRTRATLGAGSTPDGISVRRRPPPPDFRV